MVGGARSPTPLEDNLFPTGWQLHVPVESPVCAVQWKHDMREVCRAKSVNCATFIPIHLLLTYINIYTFVF